jgi:quercetin dioxygenase-like cupin family protein
MSNRFILAAFLFLVLRGGFSQHTVDATHTQKIATTILLEQLLTKEDLKNTMVRIETVIFPPGYNAVKHIHPCPVFVYVLEGELVSEFEGKTNVYSAGDTFYERPAGVHSITKNNSDTDHVKILVFYLMKEGMETFVPMER